MHHNFMREGYALPSAFNYSIDKRASHTIVGSPAPRRNSAPSKATSEDSKCRPNIIWVVGQLLPDAQTKAHYITSRWVFLVLLPIAY